MKIVVFKNNLKITTFYLVMIFILTPLITNAQNLLLEKKMKASFQNRWTSEFLEFGGGSIILSKVNYNSWEIIPVPDVPEYVYIKLNDNELYLNTENGVGITAIQPGWHSAMWKIKKVKDSEHYQLINYWKGVPLNNETKKLEVSAAEDGWFSAMWKVTLIEIPQNTATNKTSLGATPDASEYENYKVSNPYILVEEASDGGTDPAIFGNINLRLLKNGKVEKTWSLLVRTAEAGSRIICPEKTTIPLANPVNEVISILSKERHLYEFTVEAHLFDYDANSSNDLLGNDGIKLPIADAYDAPAEASLYLFGEGKVKIAATLTRTGSSGLLEVYEESKPGGAYNTNDDPDPWIYTATKNWMSLLPDNSMLKNISIPGTHDSGAKFGGPNAATQSWTISEQLNSGVRFLDIRVRIIGEAFAIHHGPIFQNIMFGDVLNEVRDFLKNNPKEVILIRVKKEKADEPNSKTLEEVWSRYFENYKNLFYSGNQNLDVTLGEVRGKVFVLCQSYCYSKNGIAFDTIDMQDYYNVTFAAHNYKGESTATIPEKKVQINKHLDKAETSDKWIINWLSGGTSTFIRDVASETNKSTFQYLAKKSNKRKLGILAMDYPGEQLIYRIIKSNFQLRY